MPHRRYLSSGLMVVLGATLLLAPGFQVQAQVGPQTSASQTLTPHGIASTAVRKLGIIDVRKLPKTSQSALQAQGSKTMSFMSRDVELAKRFKDPKQSDFVRNTKSLQAAPSGSAAPLASNGAGTGPKIISSHFLGLSQFQALCGGCEPPDTQVGAGPSFLFEAVNTAGIITDKAGNIIVGPFDLHFFCQCRLFLSDPKVRFDPLSGRWFFTIITTSGFWYLGVSTNSDPFSWFLYRFAGLSGTFPDFPGLGINDDKVVLTANAFTQSSFSFVAAEVLVLNKAELEAGFSSIDAAFFADNRFFTVQPAHSNSFTDGPLFMASSDFGVSTVIHFFSVLGRPPAAVVIPFHDIPLSGSVGPLIIPPDATQAGTSHRITTNDNRILDAAYRDGALWVTANDGCFSPKVFTACVRFTKIVTRQAALGEDLDFGEINGNFYYAAIQLVPDFSLNCQVGNDVVAVFTESNPHDFASVLASGRQDACDTPNRFRSPNLVQRGFAPYFGGRWGDYSGAGGDPSFALEGTVWVAGEFTRPDSEWGTAIANVSFAFGGGF